MAPKKRPLQDFKALSAPPTKRQNTNSKERQSEAKLSCQSGTTAAKRTTTKKGSSTKHPINIEDLEEESNAIFRHMPPTPSPYCCDTFPYFNDGEVFIIIDSHDTKYQYRLHKSVLERCLPQISKILGSEIDEFDQVLKDSNPKYKHGTRLELFPNQENDWELIKTTFTMAKPLTPFESPVTASIDSKASTRLSNTKSMDDVSDSSSHFDESSRPDTFKVVHENESISSPQLINSPQSPHASRFSSQKEVLGASSNETKGKETNLAARHENESMSYPVKGTTNADEFLDQNYSEDIFKTSSLDTTLVPVSEVPPALIENSKDGRHPDPGDLEATSRNLKDETMASIGLLPIMSSSEQSLRKQIDSKRHALFDENLADRHLQTTSPVEDNGSTKVTTSKIPPESTEDYISSQKKSEMEVKLQQRTLRYEDLAVKVKSTCPAPMDELDSSGTLSGISAESTYPATSFPSVSERCGKIDTESLQEFREPERIGTFEAVDEKSNASAISKPEVSLPQTDLEDSEHSQGLARSDSGPSGATMPNETCDLVSQVGSQITDPSNDSKSCAYTLFPSMNVAEEQRNHHEQESMNREIFSSSSNVSDCLAKISHDALGSTNAKNVTNMNFDGSSDARLNVTEDKKGCISHRTSNNDGSPSRDICELYNNIFSIFYHISPKIDTSDIRVALRQSELIIRHAVVFNCSCIVRPYICNALFKFGQDLFKAVYSQAPRLLKIGLELNSAPIVREAMVHLVGNFSSLKKADIIFLNSLGSQTMNLISNKHLQLKYLCDQVNNKLFTSTIYINGNPVQLSSINKGYFDTWVVVQLWHDYFCQNVANLDHEPEKIGILYRQLLKGGEAYLCPEKVRKTLESMDLITVTSERVLHNKLLGHLGSAQFSALIDAPLPNQFHSNAMMKTGTKPGTFQDLAADLILMKNFAKTVVKDICINNSMLDVEAMGIEYLTCTKIDDSELPWVGSAE